MTILVLLKSRWFVWPLVCLATVAVTCAPLAFGRPCTEGVSMKGRISMGHSPRSYILAGTGAPPVGSYFTMLGVSGGLAAIMSDPLGRFNKMVQLHRWTRHDTLSILSQRACEVIKVWLFAACPESLATYYGLFFMLGGGCYVTSLGDIKIARRVIC